jgi:hypothetical protein
MKLSSKRHGFVNVYYYRDPAGYHRYKLSGRTIAQILNWMFAHIATRSGLNKGDLKLVASEDGVRMINRQTGSRLYAMRVNRKYWLWSEEPVLSMSNMHERLDYNQ